MAKLNKTKHPNKPTVTNPAGGMAFVKDAKLELVSRLLTWFVNDGYYQSTEDGTARMRDIVSSLSDRKFAAKAAIYARQEFGMRSVTHILTCELLRSGVSGEDWVRPFVTKVISRVDDMTEILAYWSTLGEKARPKALLRGIGDAFSKFNTYQLGKYRSAHGKCISLVDVVRLTHPVPTDKNADGLKRLVEGTLRADDTRQAALVKATQGLETKEERDEAKAKVWHDQLKEKKIGYFEMIKNLGGVLRDAEDLLDDALAIVRNKELIKKVNVFPFYFISAVTNLRIKYGDHPRIHEVIGALTDAVDFACSNVPELKNTLVVVDVSGSMEHPVTASGEDMRRHAARGTKAISCKMAGALFGAFLVKAGYGDLMVFASDAGYVKYNPSDSAVTIAEAAYSQDGYRGHGTNFNSIFARAKRGYDRIVIFSDMQGWMADENNFANDWPYLNTGMGGGAPTKRLTAYKKEHGVDPWVYSVNLAEFGGSMFDLSKSKVIPLAGFSEKLYDLMKLCEEDRMALIHAIEAVEL